MRKGRSKITCRSPNHVIHPFNVVVIQIIGATSQLSDFIFEFLYGLWAHLDCPRRNIKPQKRKALTKRGNLRFLR